ncbi:hypothetical protein [Streptomyces sp. IB201691-2A2]|uniref:hypothetical protein n=1 Tax=Streptomyces sp. IB201691-2A2 TaxID=2561920 RepID=UPI001180C2A2|nr:hypothetical protein [Streptomyces sp. IB201691-2A2]TRO56466.1 hypothetical protein E4K73_46435 [Streptomyces sp. IB201691-2A2]
MFRARAEPGKTAETQVAGKELCAAVEAARPHGVRHTRTRPQDGEIHLLPVDPGDDALAALPACTEVTADLKGNRTAQPPAMEQSTPTGPYRPL